MGLSLGGTKYLAILVISTAPTFSKLLLLIYFGSPDVIFEVGETPVN